MMTVEHPRRCAVRGYRFPWRTARRGVRFQDAVNLGLVLLATNWFARNFGPISRSWCKAAALLTLVVLVVFNLRFPLRLKSPRRILLGAFVVVPLIVWLSRTGSETICTIIGPALLWGLSLLLEGLGGRLRQRTFYVLSLWLYAILVLLAASVPYLGEILIRLSLAWTQTLGRVLFNQPLLLGPSGMAGGVLVSVLCCLAVGLIRGWGGAGFRPAHWLKLLGAVLISHVLYLWAENHQPWLPDALPLFCFPIGFLILATVALAFFRRPLPAWNITLSPRTLVLSGCLLAISVAVVAAWPLAGHPRGKRVLFYDSGFLDWKRPVFGKYGGFESGMFGCLQDYLRPDGFGCAFDKSLTPANLAARDVLVVINPTNQWATPELTAVWDFVRAGGSLLVLGDHTDLLGSQGCLNELLAPVSTRFNFDAGYPGKSEWQDCLGLLEHPICSRVRESCDAIISVGASLEVAPPAFTLVSGRYGFGDLGNRLNAQGAFLGDYRYEKGEQLGDVALVAAAFYGRGKVLVFGDTSPFQNGALPFSYSTFVQPIFEWLNRSDWAGLLYAKLIGAALALAVTLLFLRRASAATVGLLALFCALALTASNRFNAGSLPPPVAPRELALLDRSHANRVSLAPLETDSIGPLTATLQRCGFLPISFNAWSGASLSKAHLVVISAPARRYSNHETARLKQFVQDGGILLLNSGWEEKGSAMQSLLDTFGLDVLQIPMGPFPVNRTVNHLPNQPQFINAWPVAVTDPDAQTAFAQARADYRPPLLSEAAPEQLGSMIGNLLGQSPGNETRPSSQSPIRILFQTDEGLPLVLSRQIGKGTVVLVGDTFFLGHDNLESIRFFRRGNILFLKYIFDSIRMKDH